MTKDEVKNSVERALGMRFLDGVIVVDDSFAVQRVCTGLNIKTIDEISAFINVKFMNSFTTIFELK